MFNLREEGRYVTETWRRNI